MYNFYFTSNRKALVAHFSLKGVEKCPVTEILSIQTNGHDALMSWDKDAYFATITSFDEDEKHVEFENATLNGDEINLSFVSKSKVSAHIDKQDSFKIISAKNAEGRHIYSLVDCRTKETACYTIKVKLLFKDKNNNEFESAIIFHRVPQEQIYNVVLDFGSEASQMLISNSKRDRVAITQEKLFENVLTHFYTNKVQGQRVYDQQDDDRFLFRSVFYRKKDMPQDTSFVYEIPSNNDASFNFLSRRSSKHEGRTPNIKIAYLTGARVNNGMGLQTLHRGIVGRFLHEAIRRIEEYVTEATENRKIAINFIVLLPNVMPQEDVSDFLREMRVIVNSKLYKEKNETKLNIEYH